MKKTNLMLVNSFDKGRAVHIRSGFRLGSGGAPTSTTQDPIGPHVQYSKLMLFIYNSHKLGTLFHLVLTEHRNVLSYYCSRKNLPK